MYRAIIMISAKLANVLIYLSQSKKLFKQRHLIKSSHQSWLINYQCTLQCQAAPH